jgi:GT2 family glycosyltransferase
MPRFSIIIPVFEQAELLAKCLQSIRASDFTDYEILVSDDGTPDAGAILRVVEQFGARLVRSETRLGSAAARNRAAREASGDRLAFFDADVELNPGTLGQLFRAFECDPPPDAVIGSYDNQPVAANQTSQFRNLLHAHVHQRSNREARTFWTACGAIDRARFIELGGFDENYPQPSIEDVELGLRLHRAGGRILLVPQIQVTHHKTWTLSSMVYTDLFLRAIPWTALLWNHNLPRDLNFRTRDRVTSALSALALILAAVALRHGSLWWGVLTLDLCAVAALQASVLVFFAKCRGAIFAATCFPLLLIYNVVCVLGLGAGLIRLEWQRSRLFVAAVVASACLIFGLQLAGGAYRAEFDGDPDEAAHFVSGLMVYDYLAGLPRANPITWGEQYYLHYPKVAIGHWPPGFYAVAAWWWLIFSPSRWTALWLEAALALAAALGFYRLARTLGPPWLALGATLFLVVSPVVQASVDRVMADALCLLWSVFVADACARLVKRPSVGGLAMAGLWLTGALLTKGTGACLVAAPVLTLVVSGKWKQIPRAAVWVGTAALLALGLASYGINAAILHHSVFWWGGVTTRKPWPVVLVPGLGGWGICLLAIAGSVIAWRVRRPAAVAAACVLLSAVAASCASRAMNQPRHWIMVLPALLLLSVECLVYLSKWKAAAVAAAVVALLLFPWSLYRQEPGGFAAFARRLPRPSRILVSSTSSGEGAMVAAIALSEPRPSSVVVRATKSLASEGWNGDDYQVTAASTDAVDRRLDEMGIDEVELHAVPGEDVPPHQRLLLKALRGSHSWRECGSMGTFAAWCRVLAPTVERKPLRIDLRGQIGRVIQEPASSH